MAITEKLITGYSELELWITREQDISQISWVLKSKHSTSLTLFKIALTGNSPYSTDLHADVHFLGYFSRNLHLDRSCLRSLNPKILYVSWSLFYIFISLCLLQVGKIKKTSYI